MQFEEPKEDRFPSLIRILGSARSIALLVPLSERNSPVSIRIPPWRVDPGPIRDCCAFRLLLLPHGNFELRLLGFLSNADVIFAVLTGVLVNFDR